MNNTVLEKLKELGLKGAAQSYEALLAEPSLLDGLGLDDIMLQLLDAESNLRAGNRQKFLIRQACIPLPAMLKDIIYSKERGAELRTKILRLATLDFIRMGQNINIYGSTATGKSFIASALARKACISGYATMYTGTRELISELKLKSSTAGYKSKLTQIKRKSLLILDDFCLTTYDQEDQSILFDVLNDRYGKKSTIIVSQKTPIRWNDEMKCTTLSESIVSRASSNSFELVIKGKSMRTTLSFDGEEPVTHESIATDSKLGEEDSLNEPVMDNNPVTVTAKTAENE